MVRLVRDLVHAHRHALDLEVVQEVVRLALVVAVAVLQGLVVRQSKEILVC